VPERSEEEGQVMSRWFAAHLVMYVKLKEHERKTVPVWENIVLIRAASEDEAFAKAEKRGEADAGDDGGTFRWDGKPARWVFAGVRKLTLCEPADERPGDGTEVSHTELRVSSEDAVKKLVKGDVVGVHYHDVFRG
jgi:hypothetical protein